MKLKTLSAGDYRHVGTFYNNSRAIRDSTNAITETPVVIGTTPKHFAIEPITGLESLPALQTVGECTHMIRTRWFSDELTEASWLIWNNQRFDIKEVLNLDGMKREMVMFAIRRDNVSG